MRTVRGAAADTAELEPSLLAARRAHDRAALNAAIRNARAAAEALLRELDRGTQHPDRLGRVAKRAASAAGELRDAAARVGE